MGSTAHTRDENLVHIFKHLCKLQKCTDNLQSRYKFYCTKNIELELMNVDVETWRTRALNKTEWATVLMEAKNKFKGP